MGALTPDEVAAAAMRPTWKALTPVAAYESSLMKFLLEELPRPCPLTAEMITAGFALVAEFNEIWQHPVPALWDLVCADRAGQLDAKVAEIEAQWLASTNKEKT